MNLNIKTNCPNCGAAIRHKYNHQCPYCKTMLDFNIKETEKINPEYLEDVKLIYIRRVPVTDSFELCFEGFYHEYKPILEYTNNNSEFLISDDFKFPKRIRYCIKISSEDYYKIIYEQRIEEFLKYLPFEICPNSFIKALFKYRELI